MTHVTCRLTAKNRDQLRNPTLGNRVWAAFRPYLFIGLVLPCLSVLHTTQSLSQHDLAGKKATSTVITGSNANIAHDAGAPLLVPDRPPTAATDGKLAEMLARYRQQVNRCGMKFSMERKNKFSRNLGNSQKKPFLRTLLKHSARAYWQCKRYFNQTGKS